MIWRLILCVFAAMTLTVPALVAWGQDYPTDWLAAGYENEPLGSHAPSTLDDQQRHDREQVRFRLQVEHHIGADSSNDNGLHRHGSARCYYQAAAPTALWAAGGGTDYNNVTGTGGSTQNLLTEAPSQDGDFVTETDIGRGRCWIDSDDDTMWIHNGTEWVRANDGITSANIAFNGSFDMCGAGVAVCGDQSSMTVPNGWTNVDTATFAYIADVNEGDGDHLSITASGSATEGVSQALSGLKASTAYLVVARVNPVGAGDICTLTAADGTTTDTDTSATATNVYETLQVTLTTTAVPADITVSILTTADGDNCEVSAVGAYEINREHIPQPGPVVMGDSNDDSGTNCSTSYAAGCVDIVSVTLTPSAPGMMAIIHGTLMMDAANDDSNCAVRIESSVGGELAENAFEPGSTAGAVTVQGVPVFAFEGPLTAGTAVTYSLDAKEREVANSCQTWNGASSWMGEVNRIMVQLVPSQ